MLVGQGTHMPNGLEKVKNMGIENWRTEWTDSPWSFKHPGWSPEVPTHRVEGQAGDCILCVARYISRSDWHVTDPMVCAHHFLFLKITGLQRN